jgi:membrane protein CcdC involved in cytochrome C biogenesis
MLWRVRETQSPVSARKIVIPPMGMATGFGMFLAPAFRIPWDWAATAFLAGALVLAYPLTRTSRLVRDGDVVMMRRSNWFFVILVTLAVIRIAARGYLDTVMSVQQTAGIFFVLAFGMIVRWRAQMLVEYRSLMASDPA